MKYALFYCILSWVGTYVMRFIYNAAVRRRLVMQKKNVLSQFYWCLTQVVLWFLRVISVRHFID